MGSRAAGSADARRAAGARSWAVAIVQHNGSAPASDYCFTAPERLLAPSMSANASVLTMPRSAVATLLERAVVRFRGAEPECCWAWEGAAIDDRVNVTDQRLTGYHGGAKSPTVGARTQQAVASPVRRNNGDRSVKWCCGRRRPSCAIISVWTYPI